MADRNAFFEEGVKLDENVVGVVETFLPALLFLSPLLLHEFFLSSVTQQKILHPLHVNHKHFLCGKTQVLENNTS